MKPYGIFSGIEVVGGRRDRELPAHQQHHREPDQQEQERGDQVLDPDDLVIDREDVLPDEALWLGVRVSVGAVKVCVCHHISPGLLLRESGRA
jgi:hypothetical protein